MTAMNDNRSAYFSIHLSDQIGALQRLCGTIRRRGFGIENMMVTRNPMTAGYRIEVCLRGERSFETLARHIANLLDVSLVCLQASAESVKEFRREVVQC